MEGNLEGSIFGNVVGSMEGSVGWVVSRGRRGGAGSVEGGVGGAQDAPLQEREHLPRQQHKRFSTLNMATEHTHKPLRFLPATLPLPLL